jgi:hypothetical protein
MPHTTTKALRIKRPDSRPNGKRRAKLVKEKNDDLKIQDIRVTKTHSKDKKDRNSESASQTAELPNDVKLMRALKKKVHLISIFFGRKLRRFESFLLKMY